MIMEDRDIALIRALQREYVFLDRSPFEAAARLLGWPAEEVIARAKRLKDEGVIRRFGAALTPKNAGFKANAMVAWQADGHGEEAARVMAAHPNISHCYIRPAFEGFPYCLYTMIHASTADELEEIISELSLRTGIVSRRVLTSLKEYKKSSPVYFP